MTTDEELRQAIDALGESVLVVGSGAVGRSAAARVGGSDVPATNAAGDPDAVILAVDAGGADGDSNPEIPSLPDAPVRLAAVTVPDRPASGEQAFLESLVDRVDTVVLVSGGGTDHLSGAVATLVSIVRESGVVNVDIADVETVFRPIEIATLCVGSDPAGESTAAVRNAFNELPSGVETDSVSGVLIDIVGTPKMTVADISDAVSAVRERIGPDAHVIWGGAVDDDAENGLQVRLVLAGVKNVRVAPGDHCPRCGTLLSTYTLGERTMPSCEKCGFSGISVRLRD